MRALRGLEENRGTPSQVRCGYNPVSLEAGIVRRLILDTEYGVQSITLIAKKELCQLWDAAA